MRIKISVILLIVHCSLFVANGQVSQQWVARYHFYIDDAAQDIAVDDSGFVYVTGRSDGTNGQEDYATIKYNSSGVQQWVMRYNGPGNNLDEAVSIAIDNTGNVYVTGFSRSGPDAGYNDFATIKYNSAGIQEWVRRYNFGGSDIACKVAIDGNGDILVGGWGTQAATGPDFAVIKYDTNGSILWVRTYDSGGSDNQYDYAVAMALDTSGNVYLTGSVGGNISSAPDWATVKWNSQGIFQWVQRYNGPGNSTDYAEAIAISDSGNVYVTGVVWGNNNGDYATIKYNYAGFQQWVRFYNGGFGDGATSIITDVSENVYVTGYSIGSNADYLTIKYSGAGVQLWTERFFPPNNLGHDIPCCIKLDNQGNVYITGYATVSTNNTDYCTVKYNNSGAQQWVIYYSATNNSGEGANALALDSFGNVFVTGVSFIGNADFATIKYSQMVGIQPISGDVPSFYKLFQNYPNPLNPASSIRFQLSNKGFVNLTVYDILGREIAALVNQELKPGTYEVEWNASRFTSGVYFYRLRTENYVETMKMVLIR